jgi:hypothetical protein
MSKEELIKKAWKNFPMVNYDKNSGFAISYRINGVTDILDDPYGNIEWEILEADLIKWRPISLKGIENNNGWINIESESDLPKEYDFYDACCFNEKFKNDVPMFYGCNLPDLRNYFDEELITHYRPAIKHEYPLF